MKMSNQWNGFYEYGEGHTPPHFSERVQFQFNLQDTEEGFVGTCTEEESDYAINEISKIEGFVEEDMISIVKTYKNTYEVLDGGQVKVISDQPMEIKYFGNYDRAYQCFYGYWEVVIDFEEDGIPYQYTSSGIWKMSR